jgi:hypothetical protein
MPDEDVNDFNVVRETKRRNFVHLCKPETRKCTGRSNALSGDVETHMSRLERPRALRVRANHFASVQRSAYRPCAENALATSSPGLMAPLAPACAALRVS